MHGSTADGWCLIACLLKHERFIIWYHGEILRGLTRLSRRPIVIIIRITNSKLIARHYSATFTFSYCRLRGKSVVPRGSNRSLLTISGVVLSAIIGHYLQKLF